MDRPRDWRGLPSMAAEELDLLEAIGKDTGPLDRCPAPAAAAPNTGTEQRASGGKAPAGLGKHTVALVLPVSKKSCGRGADWLQNGEHDFAGLLLAPGSNATAAAPPAAPAADTSDASEEDDPANLPPLSLLDLCRVPATRGIFIIAAVEALFPRPFLQFDPLYLADRCQNTAIKSCNHISTNMPPNLVDAQPGNVPPSHIKFDVCSGAGFR